MEETCGRQLSFCHWRFNQISAQRMTFLVLSNKWELHSVLASWLKVTFPSVSLSPWNVQAPLFIKCYWWSFGCNVCCAETPASLISVQLHFRQNNRLSVYPVSWLYLLRTRRFVVSFSVLLLLVITMLSSGQWWDPLAWLIKRFTLRNRNNTVQTCRFTVNKHLYYCKAWCAAVHLPTVLLISHLLDTLFHCWQWMLNMLSHYLDTGMDQKCKFAETHQYLNCTYCATSISCSVLHFYMNFQCM